MRRRREPATKDHGGMESGAFDAHISSNGNMLNIDIEEMRKEFDSFLQRVKARE